MRNEFMPGDLPPQYGPVFQDTSRQMKLADLLRQQSMEMPQGQMVSGIYVAPSITQYMAQALKGYNAGQMEKDAYAKQKAAFDDYQTKRTNATQALIDGLKVKTVDQPVDYSDAGGMPGMTQQVQQQPTKNDIFSAQVNYYTQMGMPEKVAELYAQQAEANAPFSGTLKEGEQVFRNGQMVAENLKAENRKPLVVDGVVLDPLTWKPLYSAPKKSEYKQRKISPDGVNYIEQTSMDGGVNWENVGSPVPIKSTVANVSATASNNGSKAFETEMGKNDANRLDQLRTTAAEASTILETTANMRKAAGQGIYSGGGAAAKVSAANFLSGIFGVEESKKLASSQQFEAETGKLVLAKIKQLGANPSNSDREFIEKTVPQLGQSAAARTALIDFLEAKAKKQISLYQRADAYARKNSGLGGFNEFDNRDIHSEAEAIINEGGKK